MEKVYNYINGGFSPPINNKYIKNYSPTNGCAYSLIPDSGEKDVDLAVSSAEKASKTGGSQQKNIGISG